jgi:type III pantothenate kinase
MLLAIDIGNTSIHMGIFRGGELLGKSKISTRPIKSALEYGNEIKAFLSKKRVSVSLDGVVISSVVPELTGVVESAVKGMAGRGPLIVGASSIQGLISFGVESPHEVGTDRIADIIAAKDMFGSPVLVVDFGTATTISACNNGVFLGGAILPGVGLMSKALSRGTSKLPMVDLSELMTKGFPILAMGKDTNLCIVSGIIYGTAGAVERLIKEMEVEENCRFTVVITGGYAELMVRFLEREHTLDPDLTLKGLRSIYEGKG